MLEELESNCLLCGSDGMEENALLFKFPSETDLLARWASFCELKPRDILTNLHLCSIHFKSDLIIDGRHLKKDAVPEFYPDGFNSTEQFIEETIEIDMSNPEPDPVRCCVCGNTSPESVYFKFPREAFIKSQWITACGLDPSTVTVDSKVCSKHFTPDDYLFCGSPSSTQVGANQNTVPWLSKQIHEREIPNRKRICCYCLSTDPKRSYFRFPTSSVTRSKWIEFCETTPDKIVHTTKLCHYHFDPSLISQYSRRRSLRENSVPTIKIIPPELIKKELETSVFTSNMETEQSEIIFQEVEIELDDHYNIDLTDIKTEANEDSVRNGNIRSSVRSRVKNINLTDIKAGIEKGSRRNSNIRFPVPNDAASSNGSDAEFEDLNGSSPVSDILSDGSDGEFYMPYMGMITSADLATPERAKVSFDVAKRIIREKAGEINRLKTENKRLKEKVSVMTRRLSYYQKKLNGVHKRTLPSIKRRR